MVTEPIFVLLMGTVLGFLSGIGVGGGSLLMLWLTLGLGMAQSTARGINLLFFIPCALVSSCFRLRQGHLPWKKLWPAVLGGCISAAIFSLLGRNLHTEILKKLFGGLLILTGIRELMYKPRNRDGP